MNYFTIRDVENLSGIKAHTWRIWEQRHQICLPQRKDSNHRFYDAENLKHILRISYLYHTGIKISNLARLGEEEVIALATKTGDALHTDSFFVKELLEASLDFNVDRFEKICREVFKTIEIEKAVLNVIYPFVERVGLLWMTDHMVPAQEHFTSNIIRRRIIIEIDKLPVVRSSTAITTILFTPEKEHHELPLLLIHYLLKKSGNVVRYFGNNIQLNSIKEYVQIEKIDRIHFHLITNFTNKEPQAFLAHVANEFPLQQIVMSGKQTQHITKPPANAVVLQSLQALLDYAKG